MLIIFAILIGVCLLLFTLLTNKIDSNQESKSKALAITFIPILAMVGIIFGFIALFPWFNKEVPAKTPQSALNQVFYVSPDYKLFRKINSELVPYGINNDADSDANNSSDEITNNANYKIIIKDVTTPKVILKTTNYPNSDKFNNVFSTKIETKTVVDRIIVPKNDLSTKLIKVVASD